LLPRLRHEVQTIVFAEVGVPNVQMYGGPLWAVGVVVLLRFGHGQLQGVRIVVPLDVGIVRSPDVSPRY
jgi:hypothetical protein